MRGGSLSLVLGINGYELILLGFIAVLVLGPDRLPEYAAQLGQMVRGLRRMASGAREQLRDEVGPELDEVDWHKLDPRQYDPRRIIREALTDDLKDVMNPFRTDTAQPILAPENTPSASTAGAAHQVRPDSHPEQAPPDGSEPSEPQVRLVPQDEERRTIQRGQ